MIQEFIKSDCFTKKWLKSKSQELLGDPILVEKTIYAFALLGYLVQLEENFVFKGGTSLLLHVPEIKRLSIDIDIIFGKDINEFIRKINTIQRNTRFIRFEENKRDSKKLPNRQHFKFFYNSSLYEKEDYILLDIVLDDPAYIPFTEKKTIETNLFEIESELKVILPTIEGLIGDKLTAFAPHTIGVPFQTTKGNSMTMQVIKQLYDIGELFDIAQNFENIRIAFNKIFEKESGYRDNAFIKKEVLQDIIDTCQTLLQIGLKGFKPTKVSNFLVDGVRKINSHLLNDKFTVDSKAKITVSKVFCLANLLLRKKNFDFQTEKYDSTISSKIINITLKSPYEKLNRLKPILPEAFYYIWRAIK